MGGGLDGGQPGAHGRRGRLRDGLAGLAEQAVRVAGPACLGRPQGHGPEHVGGEGIRAGAVGVADGLAVVAAGCRVVGLIDGQPRRQPGRFAGRCRELPAAVVELAGDEPQMRSDRGAQVGRCRGGLQPPEPARHGRDGVRARVGAAQEGRSGGRGHGLKEPPSLHAADSTQRPECSNRGPVQLGVQLRIGRPGDGDDPALMAADRVGVDAQVRVAVRWPDHVAELVRNVGLRPVAGAAVALERRPVHLTASRSGAVLEMVARSDALGTRQTDCLAGCRSGLAAQTPPSCHGAEPSQDRGCWWPGPRQRKGAVHAVNHRAELVVLFSFSQGPSTVLGPVGQVRVRRQPAHPPTTVPTAVDNLAAPTAGPAITEGVGGSQGPGGTRSRARADSPTTTKPWGGGREPLPARGRHPCLERTSATGKTRWPWGASVPMALPHHGRGQRGQARGMDRAHRRPARADACRPSRPGPSY